MYNAEFFGTFDVASLMLTAFVLFFLGLVLYLRREDRREGYPLEDDVTGRLEPMAGLLFIAAPKHFELPQGQSRVSKPNSDRESRELTATRRSNVAGTPLQPTGDPMKAGVGPGAFAQRAQRPDMLQHGGPKITPLRIAPTYSLDRRDPDPRGMTVVGADRLPAGLVTDVWVDHAEVMIRYLEVELTASPPSAGLTVVGQGPPGRRVLLPMTMAVVSRGRGTVRVDAILASQFAGVPDIASPDQVTRYEEERICAYYGAGYLYATPQRSEPLL